ncbi:MAG: hypothetical protein HY272_10185 [Gammaproteobacteria bacterium]|nr:hypothetical protein [Gammaproteobacteria bacterium]
MSATIWYRKPDNSVGSELHASPENATQSLSKALENDKNRGYKIFENFVEGTTHYITKDMNDRFIIERWISD